MSIRLSEKMHWSDEGIVLAVRKHGESSVVANLLTKLHGKHVGLVRRGAGPQLRGALQLGNEVAVRWRARLAEHLGNFDIELRNPRASKLLGVSLALSGLVSAVTLADRVLPEREVHENVYHAMLALLDVLDKHMEVWAPVYVRFELGLLSELGYGLDLSSCAATGSRKNLIWVSPRSGRAVSKEAGGPYAAKLLALPSFLIEGKPGFVAGEDIRSGLLLSSFFLERRIFRVNGQTVPEARQRFVEMILEHYTKSSDILRK